MLTDMVVKAFEVVELCKPFFKRAVEVSADWDNTAYIVQEVISGKVYVMSWNQYKSHVGCGHCNKLCELDGNGIGFYNSETQEQLVEFADASPIYKSLLGEYIK